MRYVLKIVPIFFVAWLASYGQTLVNLRTQSKNVDFSAAASTKPAKSGSALPAACSMGEMFFLTSAPAGQNLYVCTAQNIWTLQADGSGAASSDQLKDFLVTGSGPVLTIGANCSATSPCNVGFGNNTYSIAGSAAATLTSGTGVAYIYISSSGALTVGHAMTLTCSAGCVAQSGVTAFPINSIPLFTWTASDGSWNATGGLDRRAFLSTKTFTTGIGLIGSDVGGQAVLSIDTSLVGLQTTAPATSSSVCTVGSWAKDADFYYVCVSANTWKRAALSSW
jgi:hypothetical protein